MLCQYPERVWLASSALAVALLVPFLVATFSGQPSTGELLRIGETAQATVVLDRHDAPVFTIFREQRIDVPLAEVSPHLILALLTAEDRRFPAHRGIDMVRVAGAAVSNLRQGRLVEGGSTLTQQLARQGFLSREKTWSRKLKEAVLAIRLERTFSKAEILELYLNHVYFGAGLYGVEAAAMGYFGTSAADLDLAQSALLVGLVKAPSAYAPTTAPERAVERQNLVLRQMHELGVIDGPVYDTARGASLRLTNGLGAADVVAGYFREAVRQDLVERLGADQLYAGGLKVYTSLDVAMQRVAEREVARALETIGRGQAGGAGGDGPLQAALVALDPRTGAVRAMIGGRDFTESPFNLATQAERQPGSAFKPLVYAAALEHGFSPATLITDLDAPVSTRQGQWVPEDDHVDGGVMTMRSALRDSSNRAAVQMLQRVGVQAAVRQARQLGIESLPPVPSLALGTGEVSLLAMTRAFAAFANQGLVLEPALIRRVESADGRVLFEQQPEAVQGVSPATAFLLTSMLSDVLDAGTARQARELGFSRPAAGKTGTTDAFHDAWFVGYTPYVATGVWIGYDQPRPIAANGYASQLAVPLWARFMIEATRSDPRHSFTPPGNVVPVRICRLSGGRASAECRHVEVVDGDGRRRYESMVHTEYFVRGTEPLAYCPLHDRRGIWHFFSGLLPGRAPAPEPRPAHDESSVPVPSTPAALFR